MPLRATRNEGETWRQAVERKASEHGLAEECLTVFDREVASGTDEATAAWGALYEWDVLDYVPE